MLHLNKLTLDHFMCVTHAELDFSSDKVIVLNGPNGQGKSTIQAAVALCLIEEKRGNSYAEFVQSGFRGATIQLDAEIKYNPIHFEIIIDTKGSGLTRTALYNNKKYTNSEVSDLLKSFDIDYFADIIMSTQGNTDDIIKISPKERQRYLQKLLNFDFDNELVQCKNKIDEFEKMINENRSIVKFSNESIDSKNKELRDVNVLDFTEQDISDIQTEIANLDNQIKEFSKLTKEKDSLNNRKSLYKDTIHSYQRDIDEYHRKITEVAENVDKKEKIEKEIAELDNKIFELSKDLKAAKDTPMMPLNLLKEEKKTLEENYYMESAKLTEAKKHLDLVNGGKCPTCGQEFSLDEVDTYKQEVLEITENVNRFNHQLIQKETEVKVAQQEFDSVNAMIRKIDNEILINTRLKEQKKKQIESLPVGNEAEYFSVIAERQAEIDRVNKDIESLDSQISDIDSKCSNYAEVSNSFTQKMNRLNDMNKKVYENNIILENNAKIRQSIIELKDKIAGSEKLIESYLTQEKVYDEVDAMFRKTFPNYLIVKTCAKLEEEMNDFIQIVFPNMAVKLFQDRAGVGFYYTTDKSKITKWTKDEMINVRMASGFESSVLSIAFKVALCKAYNLPFAFLDEIDCFGDDTNSERLFQSLVGGGIFDQLFIISHKENVKSMIENRAKNFKMYYVKKGAFSQEEL